MSKDLPYFKFISSEWLAGGIALESFELQGLFINICAIYWHKSGKLSVLEIEQRFKKKKLIEALTDRFFSVNDGYISIAFLDEQLSDRKVVSKTNSENGKKGGRPKKTEINRPLILESETIPKQSNKEEEKEEEKEKEEDDRESLPPSSVLVQSFPSGYLLKAKSGMIPIGDIPDELKKFDLHHEATAFSDSKHIFNCWGIWCKNYQSKLKVGNPEKVLIPVNVSPYKKLGK